MAIYWCYMHFTVGTYALQILSSHYFGDHSRTPSGLWAGLDPLVIRVFRLLKLNDVLSSLFCSGSLLELRNEVLPLLVGHALRGAVPDAPLGAPQAVLVLDHPLVPAKIIASALNMYHQRDLKERKQICFYFSLFFLDFSSSSYSTLDFLNLLSNSAYFFWFSACERNRKAGFPSVKKA